jgi:hypothetical protein
MKVMAMSYPSATVAPSVVTEFVNGVKFDICEIVSEAYNMLADKKYRYFLCVEDSFIVNYAAAEKLYDATGVERWDIFCVTKGECLQMIRDYAARCEQVEKWREMIAQKNGISPMVLPKISAANEYTIKRYGVKVAA